MSAEKTAIENLKADVVIIGGGGAGVPAALTAVDEGIKDVVVLEKRFAPGGDALRANWIFAIETNLQKESGVTLTADDIYKAALEFHRYDRVNPTILRTCIKKTADTVHWLEEKGVEFELRASGTPADMSKATSHWTKGSPAPDSLCTFGWVFKYLTKKSKEAGVRFLFRTSGQKILRGADGKISGVVARARGGQEFEISTRSVILCPGSFNGNKELLRKYFPYYWDDVYVTDALTSNVGEGLQMAEEAGAAMADFCTLIRHGYSLETTVNNRCHGAGQPTGVRVNKRGKRYLAENMRDTGGNTIIQQPEKTIYTIYDDNIVQSIVDRGDPPQHPRIVSPPEEVPDFREYLRKEAKQGVWVKISDNLDEIAEWIGCDPNVLEATLDRYNYFCGRGYDEDFAKDPKFLVPLRTPPYYAIKFVPLMIETIGPVRVNENMEVLDNWDTPIPGFFAAGVITSGWESYDYGGTPGGTALGFSMTQGRIAAESAAKYVLGK